MRITTAAACLVPAIAGLLAAGGVVAPSAAAGPGSPKVCLSILAPGVGGAVAAGDVLVIGSARGEGVTQVDILVDGTKVKKTVPVKGGGFSATVPLGRGMWTIRVVAGGSSIGLVVPVEPKGAYRYHPDAGKCADCHSRPDGDFVVTGRRSDVCYRCHDRNDGSKYVHGPLGNGECTACHDPHGSSNPRLMVGHPEVLCISCHDQESSAEHMRRSRGKSCTGCHDPHSSAKAFLLRK